MSSIKRFRPSKGKQIMLACGVLLGLSAPGYGLWPLAWVGLIPVLRALQRPLDLRQALGESFAFGAAFHMTWMAWLLSLHPLTWLGFSPGGSLLVALGAWLTAGILYGGLSALVLLLYWRAARLPESVRASALLLFPILWVLGMNLLQYWALGVPWAYLEYSQHGLPAMRQIAAWSGSSSLIASLLVAHNLLFAEAFRQARPGAAYLLPFLVPTLVFLAGDGLPRPAGTRLPVAVLQGNLGIDTIRAGGLSESVIERTYRADLRRLPPGTLVVLPEEGALAGAVPLDQPERSPSLAALREIAETRRLSIISGTVAFTDERLHNAMLLLVPGQPLQYYAKRQLVPFGEFTPYLDGAWIASILDSFGASYIGSFDPGTESRLLHAQTPDGPPTAIGGLICFELIYPELSRTYAAQGADLLVNISNLGWFHGNRLLEAQFLAIGQMRATETGLPLIISNNTGISAIIGPDGRILRKTPPGRKARISL